MIVTEVEARVLITWGTLAESRESCNPVDFVRAAVRKEKIVAVS